VGLGMMTKPKGIKGLHIKVTLWFLNQRILVKPLLRYRWRRDWSAKQCCRNSVSKTSNYL